ncbi:hypothetical protein DFH07DRAFT_780502 [Mycena maculata]|uniref:Uncharacterized protein n=1 Tax=Mycena maculata TaxID=230809 RepID=A0AAD7MVD1_9AGAR|nr:hypothetical protein DFH07DRAFT_780502 [Mycena maculata]
MASPPSTDHSFPIAHSLGFTDPNKTVVRTQVNQSISRYLFTHVTPPGPSAILPRNHDGHTLSRPRINIGKPPNEKFLGQSFQFCFPSEHPNCPKRYHPISDPPPRFLERHPVLQRLLLARREVAPIPRTPSSRSTASSHASGSTPRRGRTRLGPPITPESPLSRVRGARPAIVVSPIRAIPSSVLDNLVSNTAGPSRSEVTANIDANSNTQGASPLYDPFAPLTLRASVATPTDPPPLHFEYSRQASPVSVISTVSNTSEDNSIPSPAFYTRDGSIISISSDSSNGTISNIGELGYPAATDEEPVVMDLLSLFVWVTANGPVQRLTVYPRYREGGASWLVVRDYKLTLAKIGYNTEQMGEIFLPLSKIWLQYPSYLPYIITQSNTLVFIRPAGVSTGSPDDVLDELF